MKVCVLVSMSIPQKNAAVSAAVARSLCALAGITELLRHDYYYPRRQLPSAQHTLQRDRDARLALLWQGRRRYARPSEFVRRRSSSPSERAASILSFTVAPSSPHAMVKLLLFSDEAFSYPAAQEVGGASASVLIRTYPPVISTRA